MQCPKCDSQNTYQDANLWICPECGHEWSSFDLDAKKTAPESDAEMRADKVHDAFGKPLVDGDAITVIKELKIKGSSSVDLAGLTWSRFNVNLRLECRRSRCLEKDIQPKRLFSTYERSSSNKAAA